MKIWKTHELKMGLELPSCPLSMATFSNQNGHSSHNAFPVRRVCKTYEPQCKLLLERLWASFPLVDVVPLLGDIVEREQHARTDETRRVPPISCFTITFTLVVHVTSPLFTVRGQIKRHSSLPLASDV